MKTKIIYISGSEVFNMNDVRTAFETVRRELGLGKDTVLFGVPVDADDALGQQFESVEPVAQTVARDAEPESEIEPVMAEPEPQVQEIIEPVVAEKPKRKKKAVKTEVVEPEPIIETVEETIVTAEPVAEPEVIPILSVLGGNTTKATDTDAPVVDETVAETADESSDIEPIIASAVAEIDIMDTTDDEEVPTIAPEATTIQDTDEDDPLAKLLQSVQSLNEDKKDEPDATLQVVDNTVDETDATLEKLANEFAENQDKIVNTTKSSARGGRIGKLKNILPFKKSKHNESSLMGDLFGWAGVAANDEEFAIPEFFPTAAKK